VAKTKVAEKDGVDLRNGVTVAVENSDRPRAPTDENTMWSASSSCRLQVGGVESGGYYQVGLNQGPKSPLGPWLRTQGKPIYYPFIGPICTRGRFHHDPNPSNKVSNFFLSVRTCTDVYGTPPTQNLTQNPSGVRFFMENIPPHIVTWRLGYTDMTRVVRRAVSR
jgi:hypothetical protein